MITVDHFKQELRAKMERAATQGATDILMNSGELCRSLHRFTGNLGLVACCDAMHAEMPSSNAPKPGSDR
jgi:hypothetical protein